jgi:hypothetical protein
MAKNKYDLMKSSETVTDDYGSFYPDVATFDFNSFIPTNKPIDYQLTENDIYKFYSLINSFYNEFTFYDDITLWLNDISYISNVNNNLQKKIKLYAKADIDDYYSNNY